jgi:hypothetical protein
MTSVKDAECLGYPSASRLYSNKLSSGALDTGFSTTTMLLLTWRFSGISGQQCHDFCPATSSLSRSSNLQLFSFSGNQAGITLEEIS